ncbi:MAG TPA: AAA family ATPase [Steroidobacteraceae bacterium]|jgi:hypothetical protein
MNDLPRYCTRALSQLLLRTRALLVLSGPPRVGKSTACRSLASSLLSWDSAEDRRVLLLGARAVAAHLGRERLRMRNAVLGFDDLCRYRKWRDLLQDLRTHCGASSRLIATGDAAPDPRQRNCAGDRGRHLHLRLHPWSVGECVRREHTCAGIQSPGTIQDEDWAALLEHGGFPEPFLRRDPAFTREWQLARPAPLAAGELAGVAPLHDPIGLQTLARRLAECSSRPLIYSTYSRELGVTVETVTRWVQLLARLHYGFCVRPWFARVSKALRREPKWFLRDWSGVTDPLERRRTFVACHLLKAVQGWSDLGLGRFGLHYVRDKLGREVDFLVTRHDRPWFLVAVDADDRHEEWLARFQRATRARQAFHLMLDEPFMNVDCFNSSGPVVVSARTLLSQLP